MTCHASCCDNSKLKNFRITSSGFFSVLCTTGPVLATCDFPKKNKEPSSKLFQSSIDARLEVALDNCSIEVILIIVGCLRLHKFVGIEREETIDRTYQHEHDAPSLCSLARPDSQIRYRYHRFRNFIIILYHLCS